MPAQRDGAVEPSAAGLRERHKQRTRLALEDAALRLFASRGFDETSIDAIAADADVSPRTFFRYFSTKDEVFFVEREQRLARFRSEIDVRADLSDLDALAGALIAIAPEIEADREHMLLRQQAAAGTPLLRGRLYDVLTAWERTMADAVADRRGRSDQLTVAVTAGAAMIAFRSAMAAWLASPASTSLASCIHDAFTALRTATAE